MLSSHPMGSAKQELLPLRRLVGWASATPHFRTAFLQGCLSSSWHQLLNFSLFIAPSACLSGMGGFRRSVCSIPITNQQIMPNHTTANAPISIPTKKWDTKYMGLKGGKKKHLVLFGQGVVCTRDCTLGYPDCHPKRFIHLWLQAYAGDETDCPPPLLSHKTTLAEHQVPLPLSWRKCKPY